MKYVASTELQEFTIEFVDGTKGVVIDGELHHLDMQPIPMEAGHTGSPARGGSNPARGGSNPARGGSNRG